MMYPSEGGGERPSNFCPDDADLRRHVSLSPRAARGVLRGGSNRSCSACRRRTGSGRKNRERAARRDEVRWPGPSEESSRQWARVKSQQRRVPGIERERALIAAPCLEVASAIVGDGIPSSSQCGCATCVSVSTRHTPLRVHLRRRANERWYPIKQAGAGRGRGRGKMPRQSV